MFPFRMGESPCSSNRMELAIETLPNCASYLRPVSFDPSWSSVEHRNHVNRVEDVIEKSKSHWSEVGDFDCDNEVAKVSNMELFKALQGHPMWGSFFKTFGEGGGGGSSGDLVMGEKFAEGGQAELYEVQIKWFDPNVQEYDSKHSREFVLKVFKKGIFLKHLQSQWPQGMLQHHANLIAREKVGFHTELRFHCDVYSATLLEDGRFAFILVKEKEDLRNMIDRRLLTCPKDMGPFSRRETLEAMYEVAFGMNQLHNRGIVHRDIKASNVLLSKTGVCNIADFECSVGVVGTRFFRAPEILEACKHGNVSSKAQLFTKAVDIYSYGMTCYEILTGKLPFEGHPWTDYDFVLQGQRPKLPNYVDSWIQKLLNKCWQVNPLARPSSQKIVKTLLANSATCRKLDLFYQKHEVEARIRKALDRDSKIAEMWQSLKLRFRN